MTHTKELWNCLALDPTFIRGNDGETHVANTASLGGRKKDEANARRIVACVNACDVFSTEQLETGHVKNSIAGLARQRAELLSALKGVLPFVTGNHWPGAEADAAIDVAVALVREVEDGATAKVTV